MKYEPRPNIVGRLEPPPPGSTYVTPPTGGSKITLFFSGFVLQLQQSSGPLSRSTILSHSKAMELLAGVAASAKPKSPLKRRFEEAFPDAMPPPSTPVPGSSQKKKQKRSSASVQRTKDVNSMKAKMYRVFEYMMSVLEEKCHTEAKNDPVKAVRHLVENYNKVQARIEGWNQGHTAGSKFGDKVGCRCASSRHERAHARSDLSHTSIQFIPAVCRGLFSFLRFDCRLFLRAFALQSFRQRFVTPTRGVRVMFRLDSCRLFCVPSRATVRTFMAQQLW